MADFNESLEVLLTWEGGYSLDLKDPGGETYCGISRKNWPGWDGWKVIDEKKQFYTNGTIVWDSYFPELDIKVGSFYENSYWVKQSFNLLKNQDIVDKIFQQYVNLGDRAIKLAQYASAVKTIKEDGKLGQLTADAINASDIEMNEDHDLQAYSTNYFLNEYIDQLVQYYEGLIQEHSQLKVFEHEWMLRAKTIGKRPTL